MSTYKLKTSKKNVNIIKILNKFDEFIEPESIRQLYPTLSEIDFNCLMALLTIKTSNAPFENFYIFEKVIRSLNNIVPDFQIVEGNSPK